MILTSIANSNSEDQSVYQVFWEEYGMHGTSKTSKFDSSLKDPIVLLEKLENYSNENLDKLSLDDKEKMLREIEYYLDQGITPLQRYYDKLVKYFSVPSKALLNYDKQSFYKQIDTVRRCQKQEIK